MAKKAKKAAETLGFTRINYILMAIGLGMIVIGYILLAIGDITASPVFLVLGYCAVLPVAILLGKKAKPETPKADSAKSDSVSNK
jgi:hypothetical protein